MSREDDGVLIVGAGQAAAELATLLRQSDYTGPITILGDEPHLPYQRPPLSKAFLSGEAGMDELLARSSEVYEKADITVRTGVRVEAIDRETRQVTMADGSRMAYDTLVLATGGRARKIAVPGAELGHIFYLRTIADAEALHAKLAPGQRLTIVGGGYIGLEVAAAAIERGLRVTVLEGASRVLARVTAPELSAFYERSHRGAGVDIRTGVTVSGFAAGDNGTDVGAVLCSDGTSIACDLVIVGIGLIPNTELAEAAGLPVDSGIVVDAHSRTIDPHIYAIGDCATHASHGFLDRKVRLESVPNALEQARVVACSITGKAMPVATAPWFWSDQYALKLQMVGISEGYDDIVIRGAPEEGSFIAFYLKEGRVIAADSVNRLAEFMAAKKLVAARRVIPPAVLLNESQALKAVIAAYHG